MFLQAIYNYIPERNHVYKVYIGTAILWVQYIIHAMFLPMINVLYFYFNTFWSIYALPSTFSFVPWCCYLQACFSDFLNDVEMVPVARIVTGITAVLRFHICCMSVLFLYFEIFLPSFLIMFLAAEIAMSVERSVHFS